MVIRTVHRLTLMALALGPLLGCGKGGAVPAPPAAGPQGGTISAGALIVPITVTEPSGIARPSEPVTMGIPLPKSAGILQTSNLAILDGATPLPAQFRALSRWEGLASDVTLPIRWVLADFQIGLSPGETRTVTLTDSGAAGPPSPLVVDSSAPQYLHVDTGPMQVRIGTLRGNVIDRVTLGGEVVLDDPTASRDRSGIQLTDGAGTAYRSNHTSAPEISVEEQGPMRVTLRVASELTSASGTVLRPGALRVVHRLHFYANQPWIRMHTQLENNAVYGNFDGTIEPATRLQFDSLAMEFPLPSVTNRTFRTPGVQSSGTGGWRVFQGHSVADAGDESQNFSYQVRQGPALLAAGTRHAGWIDLSTPPAGVTAGVRWFWQNYEKALSASDDRISVELWPTEGTHPSGGLYLFEGGRHKSHEIYLRFHGTLSGDPGAELSRFVAPVVPRTSAAWYSKSEALGMLDPGEITFSGTDDDARMNAAFARYNSLMRQRVGAATPDPTRPLPRNLPEARERRFRVGTWENADWYGWAHFGDAAWGDGFSSNHYDLPGFLLVHYLRLGDRAFWDEAEPHLRQATEWGQYWGIDPNPYVASLSFYEKTNHGLAPDWARPAPSHNWIRRLVLYYWLTGHRAAYDAALFNAEALWRYFYQAYDITNPSSIGLDPNDWSPLSENRFLTWTLDNVMEVHALTGDPKWKVMGEDLVQCLLYAYGQVGHLDGAGAHALGANLMSHYATEPLIRFHRASSNAALKTQVLAMMKGMIQATYEADRVGPSGSGTSYLPAAITDDWDPGAAGPESYETIFNGFAASLYAYVGWIDGNPAYLKTAHRLWADGVYYPEYYSAYPTRDARSYAALDAWGWRSGNFPGSDEKVLSRQTRAGIPYLWVMRKIQDGP